MAANPLPSTQELHLRTDKKSGEAIVHASGRITSATSDLLQRTIRELIPAARRVVLDMAEVPYIDSSRIGALVSVHLAASRAQCEMVLENTQPRIRDLFEISRLTAVFENRGGYRGLTPD